MYEFKLLVPQDSTTIVDWNVGTDAKFLMQWSGLGFTYPLTEEQITYDAEKRSVAVFSVWHQGAMIATIAIMRMDEKTGEAYLGHYLLNPKETGKGHGTAIMKAFVQLCFGILKVSSLSLRAYEYNTPAIRCYEKCGYSKWDYCTTDDGLGVLLMGVKKEKVIGSDETSIDISKETEADYHETEWITQKAFWNLHVPGCDEHLLIEKMRQSDDYLPELSKIAKINGHVVGVIMYSKAYIESSDGKRHEVLTFGPLSVDPEYQSMGIGRRLLQVTMEEARVAGYPGIVIFGEPGYYPRFGFQTCDHFGITTPDGKNFDAFMGIELQPRALESMRGRFYESKVFENLPKEEANRKDKEFPTLVKMHLPGQWV